MSSVDDWFKPPLTVFIVWGGFVACFLICGSKRIFCCDCDEPEQIEYEERTYEHLSSRRKKELDDERSVAVLRYLTRFTMILKKEDMMKRLPAEEEKTCDVSLDVSGNSTMEELGEDTSDVEMGACNITADGKATEEETKSEDISGDIDEENTVYTHILVPHPGYDINGECVKELEDDGSESDTEKNITSVRNKFFTRKLLKLKDESDCKEDSTEDKEATLDEDDDSNEMDEILTEKRAVPMFCAVCLAEYSVSERVTWASNKECSHVFHEGCMLQWLISLGRKRSKRRTFPRHPSEKRLLDFDLSCPCCRQEFISKNLVLLELAPEEEENV